MEYTINGKNIHRDSPFIVCISGSMRFYSHMQQVAVELTLHDYIVVMAFVKVDVLKNLDSRKKDIIKAKLDLLHLAKIDMCDILLVVDRDDLYDESYIGQSTRYEISYALIMNKLIIYESEGGLW